MPEMTLTSEHQESRVRGCQLVVSTAISEIAILRCHVNKGMLMVTSLDSTTSSVQDNLSKTAEARAPTSNSRLQDAALYNHGITSFHGTLAICTTAEKNRQVTYRTTHDVTATITFSSEQMDGGLGTTQSPWQRNVIVRGGKAHGEILRQMEIGMLRQEGHTNMSLRMVYYAAVLSLLIHSGLHDKQLLCAARLLSLLETALSLPGFADAESRLLSVRSKERNSPDGQTRNRFKALMKSRSHYFGKTVWPCNSNISFLQKTSL